MTMKTRAKIHRSFLIDSELVSEARRLVPRELSGNLNRIISMALQEYVAKLQWESFEREMARMAADRSLRGESTRITEAFRRAEADGL